jgi:hypothetical protein
MATITGTNLLDAVLTATGAVMPDAAKLVTAARLDQMIDSGFDAGDDLAIVGFDMSFGTLTGWFGLDPDGPSGYYNATGYPGVYDDDTGPRMTNSHGLATKSDRYQIFNYNTIETNPGNSGGPLWYEYDTSACIAGVSSTSGWAADIGSHYNSILDWIAGNDFLLDGSADAALHDTLEYAEVEILGVPESDEMLFV